MKTKISRLVFCLVATLGAVLGCTSERALESQAKVSKSDAEKVAMTQAPTGAVKEAELEKEHGKLVWSFDMTVPGAHDLTEVNVDARTGELVSVEHEKEN